MDRTDFLDSLACYSQKILENDILPVKMRENDENPPEPRAPAIYKNRLPDSRQPTMTAPYVLHQIVTSKDILKAGIAESKASVRSVFCIYCPSEQDGGSMLLQVMERLRIALLRTRIIANRYSLDVEAGLEYLCYTDDTAPYFLGEMVSTWNLPAVKMEVLNWP